MRVNRHWEKSELSILVCGRFRLVGAFVKFDPPFAHSDAEIRRTIVRGRRGRTPSGLRLDRTDGP